ncbi:uncharacterized protein LOC124160516 [Ischnura elegans]|uniref:uncharacterized protein LOC124160516 n=1 Tax=Ischnura elegans TaxID=197161 RepID=UPI001ED87C11|nr:uncharacterized protein LOC124160516 [Ischnura elegans]
MTVDEKQDYHKASNSLVFGGILTYVSCLLLVMAFASPYWIQSYEETHSEFKNMGLWEYCFEDFRYPYYQFNTLFDGCHYIFSEKYYVLREWLLPGWLMVVQAFVTLALMLSFTSQVIIALELIRWPLEFVLLHEWLLSGIAAIANAIAAKLLLLSVMIFGIACWRRDWMLYPNFNYLSWSFGFAVCSMFLHFIAAAFIYMDAKKGWEYRQESRNLVVQMHPNPGRNGYV